MLIGFPDTFSVISVVMQGLGYGKNSDLRPGCLNG